MTASAQDTAAAACTKRLVTAVGGSANAAQYLPLLIKACRNQQITDPSQLAYVLATAQHETDGFNSLVEYSGGQQYEGRKDLGNTQPGDGARFKGRGFVQITGRGNYQAFANFLKIDFVGQPDLAARPDFAAAITAIGMKRGSFTRMKLDDFLGNGKLDFVNARRIINGLDRADLIAGYAKTLYAILETCTP
jgi:predicted chitinase